MNGNIWPAGTSYSLWDTPVMAEEPYGFLPLMGIKFQSGFLWAFLFGCALVFTVAWRNLRKDDAYAVSSGYGVINKLKIGDLGGGNALTRACLLYAGTLCVIYIALTFFGKLLLEMVNAVPEIGVGVDFSEYRFDSPQWPLMIAFGFAGIAPMLKPVQVVEGWLRRRTYRAVGIPVRIEQSTRKILEILNRQSALAEELKVVRQLQRLSDKDLQRQCLSLEGLQQAAAALLVGSTVCRGLVERLRESQEELETKLRGTWLEHALKMREGRQRRVLRTYAELDLLIDWAKDLRGAWPGAEVPESLRKRERELVKDCEERLDEILLRIKEYANLADPPSLDAKTANPANGSRQMQVNAPVVQKAQGRAVLKQGVEVSVQARDDNSDKPHRLSWLNKVIDQMATDRDSLVAILAIYAEKDSDIGREETEGSLRSGDQLSEPMLKWLLDGALNESSGKGPDAEAFAALLPAFLLYALFMAKGWHDLTAPGADQKNAVVVLVSAGVETLRLAALISFPVLAAFALRQSRQDACQWIGDFGHQGQIYLRQLFQAGLLVAAVALLGLLGVSAMSSFVTSDSPERFRELLSDITLPVAGYYLSMTPIAVVIAIFGLVGADLRQRRQRGSIILGLAAALLVLTYQYLHLSYNYNTNFYCLWGSIHEPENRNLVDRLVAQLSDLRARECFLHYGGLDLLIYPGLAFLVTTVFGQPVPARYLPRKQDDRAPRPSRLGRSLAVLLGGLVWLASAQPTMPDERPKLVVGFRADAEPFSYLSAAGDGDDTGRPFHGYLAELCYDAFEGEYDVVSRTVTLENRFTRLNPKNLGGVDVLCDPVTLRMGAKDGQMDALFSPIVFVSGVSYLQPKGNPASIQITYGANSTAADVALKFCRNDILRAVRREQKSSLPQFCDTAEALLYFSNPDQGASPPSSCRVAEKEERIDCLEWAVAAELQLAEGDLKKREAAGHMPPRLKEYFATRVHVWKSILSNIAWLRDGFDQKLQTIAKKQIIRDLGGDCASPIWAKKGIVAPYRFCPLQSHREMIRWFCDPQGRQNRVYMGDREIIVAKYRSYRELVQDCPITSENGGPDLSYEPYVILVRKECVDVFMHLQRRIYELFSVSRWARANYIRAFGNSVMSQPLAYMFMLNGVEPEHRFVNTDPLKPVLSGPAISQGSGPTIAACSAGG